MKFFKTLLALALLTAGAAVSNAALAVDYKCTCTCKDDVGTWTQSCYSTADCTVCCSYKRKVSAGPRKDAAQSLIETPNGFVDGKPMAPAQQRR